MNEDGREAMTSDTTRSTGSAGQPDDVAGLVALIAAGGVWGLAPRWVPRGGYTPPNRDVLAAALAGLRRKL